MPPKILTIGFKKTNPISSAMIEAESLYNFGILCQLERFSELEYKDLTASPNAIRLTPDTDLEAFKSQLARICHSTRSQFILLGEIQLSPHEAHVQIHYYLYAFSENEYILSEETQFQLNPSASATHHSYEIHLDSLTEAINKTALACLKAIFPYNNNFPIELPVVTSSLKALKLLKEAHLNAQPQQKIQLYEDAVEEDANLETAHYHLARLYKNEHQLEKSVLCFRRLLSVSKACPRNKAIYATTAGIACALLAKADLALQWWKRAIEFDSSYINPYFNIANVYEDQQDYHAAEAYFLKAQALAPQDIRTSVNLARLYSKMGVWDKALNQYQAQLAGELADPWCHSDVATCYLNLGNLQLAKQHLQKTLEMDPQGEAGQYAQIILAGLD